MNSAEAFFKNNSQKTNFFRKTNSEDALCEDELLREDENETASGLPTWPSRSLLIAHSLSLLFPLIIGPVLTLPHEIGFGIAASLQRKGGIVVGQSMTLPQRWAPSVIAGELN